MSIFGFYTLTTRDMNILDEELDSETGFLRKLAADTASSQLDLLPVSRAGLYLLALRGIFERGRLEAMPQGPYRWRLGPTEHCFECIQASLSGPYQKDRYGGLGLPSLPGYPSDGSVCLGFTRCGCTIALQSGIELPNEDLSRRLRGRLLEVLNESPPTALRT
jgi:hypothetical protein